MKHIVIAGGTSGIGFATAKLSIDKGYSVIVLGRSKDKLTRSLPELGENASYSAPRGAIFIAWKEEGAPIECFGIRKFDESTCELKRMYLKKDFRIFLRCF